MTGVISVADGQRVPVSSGAVLPLGAVPGLSPDNTLDAGGRV